MKYMLFTYRDPSTRRLAVRDEERSARKRAALRRARSLWLGRHEPLGGLEHLPGDRLQVDARPEQAG